MKQQFRFFTASLIFLTLLFTSCVSTKGITRDGEFYTEPEVLPLSVLAEETPKWEQIEDGVLFTEHKIERINVTWKCVKIDLDTPGLEIDFAPNPYNIENWSAKFRVKIYMKNRNWIAGINTVPFDKKYQPIGIIKYKAAPVYHEAVEKYSALVFSENPLRASVIEDQFSAEGYDYAVGGFYTILKDNQIYQFKRFKRSRSACGISEDGRYLYLFAVCAENCPSGRNGLNYEESALILQKLGASEAMEFDGGHSTALEIKGKAPVKPAFQRKIPAALGIIISNSEK